MTNEELALLVQSGKRKYMADLWEQNKKLLTKLASRFLFRATLLCYDMEDLIQESYFALERAVEDYDPEKELLLTSYFAFHVKNVLNTMLMQRNNVDKYVMPTASLDAPAGTDTEDITLADMIPYPYDETEDVLSSCMLDSIRALMKKYLREDERTAVEWYYFEGLNYTQVGMLIGKSGERAKQLCSRGVRRLRRCAGHLIDDERYYNTGLKSFRHTSTSSVEMAVIDRERMVDQKINKILANIEREAQRIQSQEEVDKII